MKPKSTRAKTVDQKKKSGTLKKTKVTMKVLAMTQQEAKDYLVPVFDNMTADELDIWNFLKSALVELGYMQMVDRYSLTMLCRDMARMKTASEDYLNAPVTLMNEKGVAVLSGQALAYDFCRKQVEKGMKDLGLTPKARKIILAGAFNAEKKKAPPMSLNRKTA